MEKHRVYKNVSLAEMLRDLVEVILGNAQYKPYFYKDGEGCFREIEQCDLFDSRFKTDNQDFSEFEWEMEESHIYVLESDV